MEQQSVVIAGGQFSRYICIPGIEAEHVTLAIANATPRVEVQLLHSRHPDPIRASDIGRLDKLGFNHVCFAVEDIEAEVRRLTASGIELRIGVSRSQVGVPVRTRRGDGGTRAVAEALAAG